MNEGHSAGSAWRALGIELAACRRAAGYSQVEFARLTAYSRSTVANVETGRQHVPRDFWQRADAAVSACGALVAGYDEIEAAVRREREATARSARAARQAQALQRSARRLGRVSAAGRAGTDMDWAETADQARAAAVELWSADPDVSRQPDDDVAPVNATVALRWLLTPPDVLTAGTEGPRPVSTGDLVRLRGVRQCLKEIDNSHGGGAALPMAVSYLRREIPQLLNGHGVGQADRSLLEIAAEFQHDVGWMAYDAGRQDLAAWYFTYALRFSHAAGNRLLGGRILAAMSHQAIYLGRIPQAIDFARAARAGTQHLTTPRAAAMLAAMEACAHAAAGDARLCHEALDDAENALIMTPRHDAEPEWLDFDEGGYWGHAARAFRDLGQPQTAEQYAQKSVDLCLPGHSRTRAQRGAIQATAYVQMGEIDAAAAVGQHVVREAWSLHSGHVLGEVAELAAAIARFRTPDARDFAEQAHELLAARGPEVPRLRR